MKWIHTINMSPYGMNLHDVNSYNMNSYDITNSCIWWCWCFLQYWNHHVKLLATILRWLRNNGFTINPLKWMGPQSKRLALTLAYTKMFNALEKEDRYHIPIDWPCNATELCMFIGCVNYYPNMSPSCAHILKPLTDQSSLTTYFINRGNAKGICKMRLLMAARA